MLRSLGETAVSIPLILCSMANATREGKVADVRARYGRSNYALLWQGLKIKSWTIHNSRLKSVPLVANVDNETLQLTA